MTKLNIDTFLNSTDAPNDDDFITGKDLKSLFWTLRGLRDELKEKDDFWKSTVIAMEKTYTDLEQAKNHNKDLEIAIIQSEKQASIGLLTHGINYDIRNSLGVISGGISLLIKAIKETPEGKFKEALKQAKLLISDGKNKMTKIISNLSIVADTSLSKAWYPLKGIVEGALVILSHKVRFAHTTVNVQIDEEIEILCNQTSLMLSLLNLISNALDSMEEMKSDHVIIISSKNVDGDTVINVIDNGQGVPPEIQNLIFEPFFTTKPKDQAQGLGLFVTKTSVEKDGGSIVLDPTYTKGAKFVLKYPQK